MNSFCFIDSIEVHGGFGKIQVANNQSHSKINQTMAVQYA